METMRSQGVRHEREQENAHAFIWLDNAVVCGLTTVHDVNMTGTHTRYAIADDQDLDIQ